MKISSYSLDKIEYLSRKILNKETKMKVLQITSSIVEYSNTNENVATNIPHPRDMNVEQLECHLIELNSKKMETRGILRKLIQIHCRLGNEKRVGELLEEFNKAKYKLTTGMKAGLMDLYIKSGNMNFTKKYYDEIIKSDPSFIVDEFKVIDLATLLINELKVDEALHLIKTESEKRDIRGGKNIEPNCWRLLNSAAMHGTENETNLLFRTLVNAGFCKPNNVILGPLIRVHLKNENLSGAVSEYIKCCETYKCTPLQHELMVKLVDTKSSIALMEKVIEYTGKIHGINSAKMALIAALAVTSKLNTLREFLSEIKEDVSPSLLEPYCSRWVKENKTLPLENLFKLKNLISEANKTIIVHNLMRIYYTLNDCENALILWNELQEIDYPVSETMKGQIVTLLSNNKHPMASKI